ncbi:flagellin [Weizmannia coagulans]|uniref:Flagellin n=2 Tax=Heyndrickxia TaxID=2837504 RepID=A0AAN0T6V6_HEYCO|nr:MULTISPECIES: flagellin [Heyndrickxia]AJO23997.1 flagellin [Heyndrickxia coagulans]AKN54525.1 Flagellin protein FlaA [Heyndrickxia coagulans]ATW83955.1 flagellin [Heyndrickxia coagulans]AWP36262.1 flagellin [Heyndrickxia coagulans]KGB30683.1 flagellin [Heyndrickxia coagulans]
MIINHNIAALNTLNHLNAATNAQSKAMQKLSSGLRINGAADDAAGLAISEKMRSQIRGLDQATKNSQDATSLLQTAEGALNETHDILQRMRELAVQSSNDTNTDDDRQNIQSEMSQLESEIDRIGNTTQFNTKNLLDGSMGKAVTTAVANENTSGIFKDKGNGNAAATTDTLLTDLTDKDGNSLGITAGDKVTVTYVKNGTTTTNSVTVAADTKLSDIGTNLGGTLTANTDGSLKLEAAAAGTADAIEGITITVQDQNGNVRTAATNALSSFKETQAAADVRSDGSATFLIGANGGQNLQVDINDMRAQALGVSGLQVSTQTQANAAIKVIDNAIQKVSAERGKLGAFENRLDHTVNNLTTSSENLTSAESRIRDVDMAKEMSEQTKQSILAQAAQAMLAQANQQPQQVLQLLR